VVTHAETGLSRRRPRLRMNCGRATKPGICGDRTMHASTQLSVRRSTPTFAPGVLFVLLIVWPIERCLCAEPRPTTVIEVPAGAAPTTKPTEAKRSPVTAARRVEFVSAMVLWFAILMVGLGLVVMVMVWGRRLRQAARRELPTSSVPDPFWYLKKSPSTVAHGNPVERLNQNETGQDSDERSTP
jgi:hypothetical protein